MSDRQDMRPGLGRQSMEANMTPYKLIIGQRRLQNALVVTGLVGGTTGVITFVLMSIMFMKYGGLHYGQPMAIYMNQMRLTPFMMPQGALDASAWLMLVATYVSLLVSLPAFLILYLGGPEAKG
jgi:hypothetical protein